MTQAATTAPSRTAALTRPSHFSPVVEGWQLVELLHQGRWCSLWRASHASARNSRGSEYALKISHTPCDEDWGRQMLRREAAVSRAVAHPHLISVLSSHASQSPAFIVLPLLAGATLSQALHAQSPLRPGHALWITRQVAAALAALHDKKWLHGDLKPDNIIVQPDGHATLIDLGFAQQFGVCSARMFCGTLRYAAPERLLSTTAATGASDCYSLGVLLFELLTGRVPFASSDPHALAVSHIEQMPPDVRDIVPQVPREVSELVRQLLAKNPFRRPSTDELVQRLCRLEIAMLGE